MVAFILFIYLDLIQDNDNILHCNIDSSNLLLPISCAVSKSLHNTVSNITL